MIVRCATLAAALGVLWELYEYLADRLLGVQMRLTYSDTLLDLLMDSIGGVAAGVALAIWNQRRARHHADPPPAGRLPPADRVSP